LGSLFRSTEILRSLVIAAVRKPKLAVAVALLMLAALASTLTYTGFLVVGVVAEYLDTGRFVAGLLLAVIFARIPWFSRGKLRTAGLLSKQVRRTVMVGLLVFCLSSFLLRGDYVPAAFTGFATAFLLTFPWIRRALVGRVLSSVFKFTPNQPRQTHTDDTIIDVEFREKKD
jgi:hypothetical protein